jgi:hypothetical protein
MIFRKFAPLLLMLCQTALLAQPKPYGCSHWRNLAGSAYPTEKTLREINPSIARSDTFDILHYDISLDITDVSGKTIRAATKIRFKPLISGQDFILFDFYHITPANEVKLTADSVTWDAGSLSFSHEGNHLKVVFPDSLPSGEEKEITVYYQGIPHRDSKWGGFIHEQGYIYNLGIGISSIPPNFGKVWYPCFDSFVERATYTYHVKTSGNYRAHCQGDFLGETVVSGDTVIRSFDFKLPIPTHVSAIAASNYEDIDFTHQGVYGPVDVRLTAKPSDTAAMRSRFTNIGKAIDACEFWYGPNNFGRVGYVITSMGALEIPQNIAYPAFLLTQPNVVNESLIAHELGHYWWGDWIAPFSHNDMWLKEGPAEYSSHLMTEFLSGREAFVKDVKDNHYYVLTEAHVRDKGFWPLSPVPDAAVYGLHTYNKGAAVMHNLRGYLGDTLFRKGMRGIQTSMGLTTFTPEQFRDSLEAETGVQMDDFFNDQVFTSGFSVYVADSFKAVPESAQWKTTLYLRQLTRKTVQYHQNVPLDVTFYGSENQVSEHLISAGSLLTEVSLNVPFEPRRVILNRNNRLNQARMDHEFMITPQQSIPSVVPFVDFRIFKETITDTAKIRIEHIWAGPDTSLKGPGIDRISANHYWVVSGTWKAGDKLAAQLSYNGANANNLDFDLFEVTESRAILVYRRDASEPWRVYNDFTVNAGSLTNGAGTIRINTLIPGEYAFAKGNKSLSIFESFISRNLNVYPNPAGDMLFAETDGLQSGDFTLQILSADGRLCLQENLYIRAGIRHEINTNSLSNGSYLMSIRSADGLVAGIARFVVLR